MLDDCNINNLAKNQVSAVFHLRAIRRSVLPKFTELCTCPLCHHEQQTLSHLLITCIKTASFWQTFQVWWYGKTDENLLLNQGKILYGFFENTAHWQALSYLIILAKYHIFCTNGHKDEICFQSFLLHASKGEINNTQGNRSCKKTIT